MCKEVLVDVQGGNNWQCEYSVSSARASQLQPRAPWRGRAAQIPLPRVVTNTKIQEIQIPIASHLCQFCQTQKILDEILVKFLIIPSQPFRPSVFDWTGSSKAISSRNLHESPAKRSPRQQRQQLSIFSANHLKKWCRREIEFKT